MPSKKGKKKQPVQTEKDLTKQICLYIKTNYPDVYFFTDPSGMYQKSWAAKAMLKNNRSKHAQLDLILLHPIHRWHGCIIELKREGEKVLDKNGDIKKGHLSEQLDSLLHLSKIGYHTAWGVGFDEAKREIDFYLKYQENLDKI